MSALVSLSPLASSGVLGGGCNTEEDVRVQRATPKASKGYVADAQDVFFAPALDNVKDGLWDLKTVAGHGLRTLAHGMGAMGNLVELTVSEDTEGRSLKSSFFKHVRNAAWECGAIVARSGIAVSKLGLGLIGKPTLCASQYGYERMCQGAKKTNASQDKIAEKTTVSSRAQESGSVFSGVTSFFKKLLPSF